LALVVDGQVYVRAANGPTSSWHRASITQGTSRARVEDRDYEVTFAAAPADVADAIDTAYENKYPSARRCRSCRATAGNRPPWS
jgi:hypothetical protein